MAAATAKLKGLTARVRATLQLQSPVLTSQLDAFCEGVEAKLVPTPAEQLYTCVCELITACLGTTPAPPDAPPPAALAALGAIDTAFGLSNAPMTDDAAAAAVSAAWGPTFARDFSPPPRTLTELLAKLEGWRVAIEASLAAAPTERLEETWGRALSPHQPLVEVPGQYNTDVEPALDQHALVERLQATVAVRRDAATGATTRIVTLIGDDCVRYPFAVDVATPLQPSRALRLERVSQLVRLLNRRLLESREARRRALRLSTPGGCRLSPSTSLVAADASALSLGALLARSRADAGVSPYAAALAHQRTVARDEPTEQRLRQAFEAASAQVPADSLSKALHAGVPSAEHLWQLRRAFAGQLGLHSLACYSLGLRATQPQAITVARASGAVVLDGTFDATPPPAGVAVPFRLTRNLQHFLAPHAVDGAFAAAACAAAGALSAAPAAPSSCGSTFSAASTRRGRRRAPRRRRAFASSRPSSLCGRRRWRPPRTSTRRCAS